MDLALFNKLTEDEAASALATCCGARRWVRETMKGFPFESTAHLAQCATTAWYRDCAEADWREAFTHHPKIGDVESLQRKYADTAHLAGAEQAGVRGANPGTLEALAMQNGDYERRNGFIFIVCATGRKAPEMLRLLQDRMKNEPAEELLVAMGEQHKITMLRLQKLLPGADWSQLKGSQLTTHVLDTSVGKPGKDITIRLQQAQGPEWLTTAQGVTNADGRIPDLLPPGRILPRGHYRMVFDTGAYFAGQEVAAFYPTLEITFTVFDDTHYHVPLLVNPFGYSTYRGS